MDWARAKNVILIVLILLNLFMLVNILNVKKPFDLTGQYQKDAKQALETVGVTISGSIPAYKPMGRISYLENESDEVFRPMIRALTGLTDDSATNPRNNSWQVNGKSLNFSDDSFVYRLENSTQEFPVEDQKKLDQMMLSWIKENKISDETFILDGLIKENDMVTIKYIRQYRKVPLFSQSIVFTLVDKKLTRVEGTLKVFEKVKLSKAADEIISANIVLLTGKDKVQGTVQSIDLGYLSIQNNELYDTPVWRVILATGDKVWFNAYTGEWLDYQ